jgi:hypothetical protein
MEDLRISGLSHQFTLNKTALLHESRYNFRFETIRRNHHKRTFPASLDTQILDTHIRHDSFTYIQTHAGLLIQCPDVLRRKDNR